MSVTIDNNLLIFKDKTPPGISSVTSLVSTLTTKLGELSTKSQSASSDLSASYQGDGLASVTSAFSSINAAIEGIKASFGAGPENVCSLSSTLITSIEEIVKLKNRIDEIESELSKLGGRRSYNADKSNKAEVDAHNNKISLLETEKSEKETQFNEKHEDCKSQLAAIKAIDPSINISTSSATSDTGTDDTSTVVEKYEYGEVLKKQFTSKDGVTIDYYVYVPKNSEGVVSPNLPTMLYMHGDSTNNGKTEQAINQGLPKMIVDKKVSPQGIVIMPFIPGTGAFDNKNYQSALVELTTSVVDEYKGDKNRVSVSGHSHGGMTAYTLVNQNPGYFSCVVPISGSAKVTEAFKGVKVWSFNSVNEQNNNGGVLYNSGVNAIKNVNKVGGQGTLTPLRKRHRYTNDETFEQKYTSPDGKEEYVYEWMFRQTRA